MGNALSSLSSLAGGIADELSTRQKRELDQRLEQRKLKLLEDEKMFERGLAEREHALKVKKEDLLMKLDQAKLLNEQAEQNPITPEMIGPLEQGQTTRPHQGIPVDINGVRTEFPGTMQGAKAAYPYVDSQLDAASKGTNINESLETYKYKLAHPDPNVGAGAEVGYDLIVDQVAKGEIPPPTSRGFSGNYARFLDAAAKKGVNLTKLTNDYYAIQRHIATLEGRQQVQIRQSAKTVQEGLAYLKSLNHQLSALSPRFAATPLNKIMTGALVKEFGVKGQQAQIVASQIYSQIADMQPELANVYRAGGTPTDDATKLAKETLHGDWSPARLDAGIEQSYKNLGFRLNAIQSSEPIGSQGPNFYNYNPGLEGEDGQQPEVIEFTKNSKGKIVRVK